MKAYFSFKKAIISVFIIFNTLGVIRANRMAAPIARCSLWQGLERSLGRVRLPGCRNNLDWYLSWYPYLTGTDLMAVMFSTLSRREWTMLTTAKYGDSREVVLPLPRQSPRSFMQRTFFDSKEAKFHNNMYGSEVGRQMYAYYLCRAFPVYAGRPVQSIVFRNHWRDFLNREEALRRGRHTEEMFYDYYLNEFSCPDAKRVRGHDS